eukprot:5988402-Pyramimonas_sp.AAC.2
MYTINYYTDLSALNSHADVGHTYYGPKKSRSRIDYFIVSHNLREIIRSIRLDWRAHKRVRGLEHVPDNIPMVMRICMPINTTNPLESRMVWDWGALAAGLQTGYKRVEFLTDLAAYLER